MNTICIIANNKTYKGDKMQIKPCRSRSGEIFCLVELEENEMKHDILKKEDEIRELCLKLCENEDEATIISDCPIVILPITCESFEIRFLII